MITRIRNIWNNSTKASNNINLPDIPIARTQQNYTMPGLTLRSDYDNAFAQITSISDEVIKRNIHLGDYNDPEKDVSGSYAIWNAMLRPNDRMGFLQFVDVLIAGFLAKEELSLLVYHAAKDGTAVAGAPQKSETEKLFDLESIAGFVIVPNNCKSQDADGNDEWEIDLGRDNGGSQKFSRADIMTIQYSFSPENGVSGVSPGSASSQEAAIQDRVNQYQRAFFDNGATPSIIVTIYARTHDEATAIQQAYERNNRGADKAQGVVYQTVIDSPIQGASEPHIEITTVGTPNSDLALKDIVEFTERKITSNYSVSPIMHGDATSTTYQNQNLAKSSFMETVQSTLVRLFSSFENELARICQLEQLPFTFVWDDVEIDITEEQKLKAEINLTNVRSFVELQQSGATPEQAALALGLPDEWKAIEVAVVETPDVAPDPPTLNEQIIKLQPLTLSEGCSCPEHNALPERVSETEQSAQKKILKLLEQLAKSVFDGLKTNATTTEINEQIIDELTSVMQTGADKASIGSFDDMDKVLADFGGLSQQSVLRLEKRAKKIVTNYVDFVTEKISGLADDDPAKKVFTDFYKKHGQSRATLIAQQETKNAYQNGELDLAENVERWLKKNQPQSYIVKTWQTTSDNPCPFCKKMDGVEAGIRDSFVPGGLIESDDVTLALDPSYSDGTIPDAHANCQCVFKFKLISKGKYNG